VSVSQPVLITQMFQTPAVIAMSIAATRMHRSLTDFSHSGYHTSPPPFCHHTNCGRCRRSLGTVGSCSTRREQTANSDPNRKFSAPIPLDKVEARVEVAVHTSSGDCPPTKTGQYELCGSYSKPIQPQDKPLALSINSDIESGVERE
jgi:hypothetical protein